MDLCGAVAGVSFDVTADCDAVDLHGREDAGVQVCGGEEHDGGEEELYLKAVFVAAGRLAEQQNRGSPEDESRDETDDIEDAEGATNDSPGEVLRRQEMECDRGEDECKEDDSANPDDDGEQAEDLEECGHSY